MKNILLSIATAIVSTNIYADSFQLLSPDISSGEKIKNAQVFNQSGCHGNNLSPKLTWNNPPSSTQSFAITMYDPDAPKGWWHWLVFNIPSDIHTLEQNAGNPESNKLPKGAIQSQTDFGSIGYNGPCPPAGDKPHRYIVTLYALKNTLPFDANTPISVVGHYIKQNKIAESAIIAIYNR